MDTERDRPSPKFPLWEYLTQPVFSPKFKALNPFRFWQIHNAEQLETCWQQSSPAEPQWIDDPVQFLEACFLNPSLANPNLGIQLIQDPNVIQFLERCWEQKQSHRNFNRSD